MAPVRFYRWLTYTLGGARGLFLPFGIAALVAMGVHLGSDAMVDAVFVALNAFDRLSEGMVTALLELMETTGWPEEGWAARNAYAFADWIDIDTREQWARWGGVIIELLVDVLLVRAALGWREPTPRMWGSVGTQPGFRGLVETTRIRVTRVRRSVNDYFKEPNVEKIYLPLATVAAVGTGCYAIGLASENTVYDLLARLPDRVPPPLWLPRLVAAALALLLIWRLGWRMLLHSFAWAEAHSEKMNFDGVPRRRRRLTGLIPALIVLPVLLIAVLVGTPLGHMLGLG